jgi:threonine dehydratase
VAAIERLGGRVVKVPFERWWQVIVEHSYPGQPGLFIHPVSDTAVMAGNGTIGVEILDRLPDVDAVLVPWGGGGLACGIAAALRGLHPRTAVYGCEITTAAPLTAALAAGALQAIDYQPSFVDGIGGKSLLPEMWPLAQRLIAGSRVVSLAAVAAAVRHLAERHRVIAEGAGATALAVALTAPPDNAGAAALAVALTAPPDNAGAAADAVALTAPPDNAGAMAVIADAEGKPARKIVCIVSGGNIDAAKLATILAGGVP